MRFGQPISFPLSKWYIGFTCLILACAWLASCSDPVQEANDHAAAASQALERGQLPDARLEIEKALSARDDAPELFLLKGRIELASGSEKRAYAAYASALSLDAASLEALQAVSQLGLRTGNLRESLDATERLLVLKPDDPDTLVVRGVHAFLQHRFEEAIGFADRSLASQPGNESALILKSRSLFLEGKPEESLRVINSAPGSSSASVGLYRTKLELFRAMRDPQGMLIQFDALRKLVSDPGLRIDEADLHYKLGESSTGRGLLAQVLSSSKTDPASATAALAVLEAYNDALTPSQAQVIARSGSLDARGETARWAISMGRADLAEPVLGSIPQSAGKPFLAGLELLRGNVSKALASARDVLTEDETNCDALTTAASALLARSSTRDAVRDAQRAAAECPDRADPWMIAASAYSAQRDWENAERVFRDGLEANPQSLRLTETFGNWLLSRGRRPEAQAVARLLTRKAPAFVRAWEYYLTLCATDDIDCRQQAFAGLKTSKTLYGPDPDPTKMPEGGLFGRLVRR